MKVVLKCIRATVKFILLVVAMACLMTYIRLGLNVEHPKHYKELKVPTFNYYNTKYKHNTKYILVWTLLDGPDWEFFKESDAIFADYKCKYKNCYFTSNRKFFGKDYTKFHAVLFNGKSITDQEYTLPKRRSLKQIYIFATKDSAAYYPVCDPKFDNFFNLTWTYRLDSDVPWPFFYIHDYKNKEVAPRINAEWTKVYEPAPAEYSLLAGEKEDAGIWIASNCLTKSRRESLFSKIKFDLKKSNLNVDSVGACGIKQCPIDLEAECLRNMHKYYFYFAFENSLAEDYVTEKVEKAFKNYIVPVVYGEADYNRFLPPHSYIDVKGLGVDETTKLLIDLTKNISLYLDYFRWKNHYEIVTHNRHICKICELLNNDFRKEYKEFRNWWNPDSLHAYGSKPKKVC